MYSINDLLEIVRDEQADELRLAVGSPPVIIFNGEANPAEGPALTIESVEQLLLQLADTRQRRILREKGRLRFLYQFRRRTQFLVTAEMQNEEVRLTIS